MPEFLDEQERHEHGCLPRDLDLGRLAHLAAEVVFLLEEEDVDRSLPDTA